MSDWRNVAINGRELFEYMQARFNMTEEEAIASMRKNNQDMSFLDDAAKRRMAAWQDLPEPRVPWAQFKKTWKDSYDDKKENA